MEWHRGSEIGEGVMLFLETPARRVVRLCCVVPTWLALYASQKWTWGGTTGDLCLVLCGQVRVGGMGNLDANFFA